MLFPFIDIPLLIPEFIPELFITWLSPIGCDDMPTLVCELIVELMFCIWELCICWFMPWY